MKTQNNFYKSNRIGTPNDDTNFRAGETKSASKTKMPYIKTSNNNTQTNFYRTSQPFRIRKEASTPSHGKLRYTPKYDTDEIRSSLLKGRSSYMIKSNEYNELKIAYAKLQEDNMNNKMIIEEILGIDSDEPITSQELREKIENKQLNPYEEELLKKTKKCITLASHIEKYKKILANKDKEIESMKNDAKVQEMLELHANFTIAKNELRQLTSVYERTYAKLHFCENKINDLNIKCEYYKKRLTECQSKVKEMEKAMEDKESENDSLKHDNGIYEEKLRKKDNAIKKMQRECISTS